MNRTLIRREIACGVLYDRRERSWRTCSREEADRLGALPETDMIDYSRPAEDGQSMFGAPIFLFLDITNACQCRCDYCYNHSGEAGPVELTRKEIMDLIGRFAQLGGIELRLAGGEPTLREDLIDLLEHADSLGLRSILVTNGLILRDRLERLARAPVTAYYISIQGDEPTNDSIRGPGSYRQCIASAEFLLRRKAEVRLSMVFHKRNWHCVSAVAELAARIGANVAFNPLRPLGRAIPAMMLSAEEHRRLVLEVMELRRRFPGIRIDTPWDHLAAPPGPPQRLPYKRLGCGDSSVSVTPSGDCYGCGQLGGDKRFCLGNIRRDDLAAIWRRSRTLCPIANAALPRECAACPYLEGSPCFGGCAATALSVRGSLDAGDPYCFVNLTGVGLR